MQSDQHRIHKQGGNHCLDDTNGDGLGAHLLQLMQPELTAHGKGNKAQCRLGQNTHPLHLLHRAEAKTGDFQSTQAVRAQKQTCHQICGYCRQIYKLRKSGHHKTADGSHSQ